jgi:hypothetical protein
MKLKSTLLYKFWTVIETIDGNTALEIGIWATGGTVCGYIYDQYEKAEEAAFQSDYKAVQQRQQKIRQTKRG